MTHVAYMKDKQGGDMPTCGLHKSRWVLEVMMQGLVWQATLGIAAVTQEGYDGRLTWLGCQRTMLMYLI